MFSLTAKKSLSQPEAEHEEKSQVPAPRFIEHLDGQVVTDGDQVTLQCRISGEMLSVLTSVLISTYSSSTLSWAYTSAIWVCLIGQVNVFCYVSEREKMV